MIQYTILESTTKHDPFYLQNLTYDVPFDITTKKIDICITIPKGMSLYVIDDLQFTTSNITFNIEESGILIYRVYVANHRLCESCSKREAFCITPPEQPQPEQSPTEQSPTEQPQIEPLKKALTINLQQPYAQAYTICHHLGDGTSIFTIDTIQNHLASHTTSKLKVKSVLDDTATCKSNNTIKVSNNLTSVIAEQVNHNLILSEHARTVSIPNMEIKSNDVSCKHGATIKHIDQQECFYLESRGIERSVAQKILIDAFLQ